ncbi:MAG: DUF4465 domain-containing protein [Bacteroidetes bacterium]|nr:DUF4465 domain-containing protein [Bacteroidota bacterium]
MKKYFTLILCAIAFNATAQIPASFDGVQLSPDTFINGSHGIKFFQDSKMTFPVVWDTSWGGFWAGGWALSNQSDSTRMGTDGLYQAINGKAHSGQNYLVGQEGSEIYVDNINFKFIDFNGFYVNNTSYAYYSMRDGDGFAKKFGGADGNDPDYLILHIAGKSGGNWLPDTIEFPLADFRFANNSEDYIVSQWQFVDTRRIRNADTLVFFYSSSDTGQFGINTPTFFVIDDAERDLWESVQMPSKEAINVYPNPASSTLFIEENKSWMIYSVTGQMLLQGDSKDIDIRSLKPGTYILLDEQGRSARFIKQ